MGRMQRQLPYPIPSHIIEPLYMRPDSDWGWEAKVCNYFWRSNYEIDVSGNAVHDGAALAPYDSQKLSFLLFFLKIHGQRAVVGTLSRRPSHIFKYILN